MEKISSAYRMRNKEIFHRVEKETNILHRIYRRRAILIGHILHRNCLLNHVIQGIIGGRVDVRGR